MTSHDVVAKLRRAFSTRKVGHAGTLDPMATGVLVVGIERGTKLLAHLVANDKRYAATIRLGQSTTTDDAEGDVTATHGASRITDAQINAEVEALTGEIMQKPTAVSAIKIDGKRAHEFVREGKEVNIPARPVTIFSFDIGDIRREGPFIDVDVRVHCSSGTYIRALARDLGAALGVGGHLTALRRTRIGAFRVEDAAVEIDPDMPLRSAAGVAAAVLGALPVTADEARDLRHGKRLPGAAVRLVGAATPTPAAIDPDGRLIGIVERRGDDLKSAMNMAEDAS